MNKNFYITTPIYYASGSLHLGHCCTSVYADSIARFKRLQGYNVMFLTGADEHGQKVELKAKEKGVTPQEFVDELDKGYKQLWKLLNISYDKYIRTTDADHCEVVQKIYEKLFKQGDIYKSKYEGWYCIPCESFFTESQLIDGKCPDCGREVKLMQEESYFFKLSKYQKQLEKFYEENPDFFTLEATKNEMLNSFIKPGLQDLCVSRTSFTWGVPLTFDEKHVSYVWIDALSNYITALGYLKEDSKNFENFWPANLHLVGKEIVRFHVIIWPILLMALNLPLPKKCHAHGWITGPNGQKMSKSFGNGVDPEALCARYGVDALRFFLLKDGPIMKDIVYTPENFINLMNTYLCNGLGNLLSRTTAMLAQNFDGVLPKCVGEKQEIDKEFEQLILSMPKSVAEQMDKMEIGNAIQEIFKVVDFANKYIEDTAPWKCKEDKERLSVIFSSLYNAIFSSAVMLQAFIPQTSERILSDLGLGGKNFNFADINTENFETFAGNKTIKGEALFPRLKMQEELNFLQSK